MGVQRASAAVLLGVLSVLAACGGGGFRQERPRPVSAQVPPVSHDDWRAAGYRQDWVGYPFMGVSGADMIRDVVVGADAVVLQEKGSRVSVLEATNGQLRWSTGLANPLTRFVGLTRDPSDANRLIVSSQTEAFTLNMTTGALIGREPFSRVVNTAQAPVGGVLVYGTSAGEVLAHRLGGGIKAWGFMGVGTIEAQPVQVGEFVASVSQRGDVTIFDPRSGTLVGRGTIYGGVESNPVAGSETVYIAGLDQSVWAFRTDGSVRWRHRTPQPLRGQPRVDGGNVYVEIPGEGFTALDAQTGAVRWSNKDVGGELVGTRSGRLIVFGNGRVSVLETRKGGTVASFEVPRVTRILADAPADGNLYAITDNNLVVKFAAR